MFTLQEFLNLFYPFSTCCQYQEIRLHLDVLLGKLINPDHHPSLREKRKGMNTQPQIIHPLNLENPTVSKASKSE